MPPPVAHPRTPQFALPPGSVDCHMHLFGPYDRYPPVPESKYITADCLPEDFIAMMDRFGIAMGVFVPASPHGTDPTHLIDVLREYPDRFIGIAILGEDADRAAIARLDALGVKGARFQSATHGSVLPALSIETARRIHDFGWHVELYPHGTEIADMEEIVASLPNKVVFDHFGSIPASAGIDHPAFAALLRMLDSGKVWVKLSRPGQIATEGMPHPSVTPIARALIAHAPERMLWGSDWPHVGETPDSMPDDGVLLDVLADWAPDEAVRTRILVDNPDEFFALDGAARRVSEQISQRRA